MNEAEPLKRLDHIVDTGRRGAKEILQIAFCRRLSVNGRISINKRQILALQRCPWDSIEVCT